MHRMIASCLLLLLLPGLIRAETDPHGGSGLRFMLDEIRRDARETAPYTGRSQISVRVMDAMGRVPRERYVPSQAAHLAYFNRPLAIGHGQTISQPFIVALMTDLLDVAPTHKVLEIGTGSGYQAAILGELVRSVYTIEIVPALAQRATETLAEQGYDNVHVRAGDGWFGWPEQAPFDAVIVTAVAEEVPPRLLDQVAPGGRMVMPLVDPDGAQMLVLITKVERGSVSRRDVLPVAFVPLTGDH